MPIVKNYFNVVYGVNLELNKLDFDINGINFVSRTSHNNGVVAKVKKIDGIIPNPLNTISVASSGSVMESFLQKEEYYSGRDLYYLKPKIRLNNKQLLYYCLCLRANKYRFNYGRQANKTLSELIIPSINEIPTWVETIDIPNAPNKNSLIKKKYQLDINNWAYFCLRDIFNETLDKGKCNNASSLLEDGNEIAYVGAKKTDNGIINYVKKEDNLITKGNCIVFISDGQGSVGYSLYWPVDFIGTTNLKIGRIKELNVYRALFLVAVLDLERFKYSFGRKYKIKQILSTKIKLPVDKKGNPDWEFMEDYIKSLPYSANL